MNKQIIQEISDVFYDRLTDDVFERYDELSDIEFDDELKYKAKKLISKDIDNFAEVMKTLGKIIPKEEWLQRAYKYIDQ